MQKVSLTPLSHRGKKCIGIYFPKNAFIQKVIHLEMGAKWSRTNTCWYTPATPEALSQLTGLLKGKAILTGTEGIKAFLMDRTASVNPHMKNLKSPSPNEIKTRDQEKISEHNLKALKLYQRELILKGYSSNTIKTYTNEFRQFLIVIKDHHVEDISTEKVKDYFQYCHEKLRLSENTLHSRINAMKFYYERVLGKDKFFWKIPRPKKHRILPKLLSEDELMRLFNALTNKKHKAMLFTIYSAGLRVSELVNLRIADIDSNRMQIFISYGKGKKDRYVNLSPVLLDILRNYIKEYKPRPSVYLFESEQTSTAYPVRTVQQIFSNAKRKAGIKKEVGIHSLRHSFATHLLEKGTNIKYIKDLLGHFNIKTTEIYLHVSKEKLVNVVSPFDDLWQKGEIKW